MPYVHGYPIRVMEMHTSRLGSWQDGDKLWVSYGEGEYEVPVIKLMEWWKWSQVVKKREANNWTIGLDN